MVGTTTENRLQRNVYRPLGKLLGRGDRLSKAKVLVTVVSAGLMIWSFDWAAMFISSWVWGPRMGGSPLNLSSALLQKAFVHAGQNGTLHYLPSCVDMNSYPATASSMCQMDGMSNCFTTTFTSGERHSSDEKSLAYYAFDLMKQEGAHWVFPVLFSVCTAGMVYLRQENSYKHSLPLSRVLSRTKTLLACSAIFAIAPTSYLLKHCQNAVSDAVFWQADGPLGLPIFFAKQYGNVATDLLLPMMLGPVAWAGIIMGSVLLRHFLKHCVAFSVNHPEPPPETVALLAGAGGNANDLGGGVEMVAPPT